LSNNITTDFTGLKEKFNKMLKSISAQQLEPIYDQMGKSAVEILYKRVKSGYGVDSDTAEIPEKDKLASLTKHYISWRKGAGSGSYFDYIIETKGKLADKPKKPKKSRSLISSIKRRATSFISSAKALFIKKEVKQKKVKIKKPSRVTGEFGSPGRSNLTLSGQMLNAIRYRANKEGFNLYIDNSSRQGDNSTNAQIASYVRKKRPFFALTGGEQRIVLKSFTESLMKALVNIK
jgi:hypothetical protein